MSAKDSLSPQSEEMSAMVQEEFTESFILLQASLAISGLKLGSGLRLRYRQRGRYCSFLVCEDTKDNSRVNFSNEHVLIVRHDFCDPRLLKRGVIVKKNLGDGIVIRPKRKDGEEATFISGPPLAEMLGYLRALYLCMMDKGEVPVGNNVVRVDKKYREYQGMEAVFLIVVNSESGVPIWEVPRGVVFLSEMGEDEKEILENLEEAMDYEED